MGAFIDLTGCVFGRLTVVSRAENRGKHIMWNVLCACGVLSKPISATHLRQGARKSCGCFSFAQVHGQYSHELYATWNMMLNRCYNTNHTYYHRYGGRGVRVCERWWALEKFIEDMHPRPKGYQLERVNNNKGYEPGNVTWSTRKVNNRNKCNTVYVVFEGQTLPLTRAAELSGIRSATLHTRLRAGKSLFAEVRKLKDRNETTLRNK